MAELIQRWHEVQTQRAVHPLIALAALNLDFLCIHPFRDARATGSFSIADLQRECPGVSVDMIRHVLKNLREKRKVECLGRGRNAVWKRTSV
jgi:hypothetical protein